MNLGDRIRSIRKRRGLSQRELAATSGVSLSLIRKLEQGELADTSRETLRKLATAMHITTMTLAHGPHDETPTTDNLSKWEPVRRALAGQADPATEEPTLEAVTSAVAELMPVFRANRYTDVLPHLPALIRDAYLLGSDGRAVRAKVLNMAGTLLTHTHQYDIAELALAQALDDAEDRFEGSAVAHNLTWLMIRRGELDRCTQLATQWADQLEPRFSRATHREIASWGWMLIRIAMSAVRDNQPGLAHDAMRLAHAAATIVGQEFQPAGDFLRPFGPLMVVAKTAELAMIEDKPDRVLALHQTIPLPSVRPDSDNWNRHLLDVSNAYLRLGQMSESVGTLQRIHRQAPEWLVEQRYAREVVAALVERRRTLTPEMRELADAVRLQY
jgi:transcriptional regulator with XRE-family HTH domain